MARPFPAARSSQTVDAREQRVKVRRPRTGLADNENRRADGFLLDLGVLGAVIDEAEPLDQQPGEHRDESVAHGFGQIDVAIERIQEHVERIEERHVAEVGEAGGLARSVEQLVTNDRRHMVPITSIPIGHGATTTMPHPSSTSNPRMHVSEVRPRRYLRIHGNTEVDFGAPGLAHELSRGPCAGRIQPRLQRHQTSACSIAIRCFRRRP